MMTMERMKRRASNASSTSATGVSSSNSSSSSSSSSSTDNKVHPHPPDSTKTGRRIWKGRVGFLLTLLIVAIAFGWLSYHLLERSERILAERQFDAIANRATCSAKLVLDGKRLGVLSLASMIAGMNPSPSSWPSSIQIDNYEQISTNLIDTSKGCYMAFLPIVQPEPEEMEQFEQHAYQLYETAHKPKPYPNGTAVQSFGKGIWSLHTQSGEPYHDTTGITTSYESRYDILTPMLYHTTGPNKNLMMNMHSIPLVGSMMDDILDCAELIHEQKPGSIFSNSHDHDHGTTTASPSSTTLLDRCMMISPILPNRTSWVQGAARGPGSIMINPVYPLEEPTKMTGVIATSIVWEEIMMDTYPECVSGIDVTLKNSLGDVSTYTVVDGQVQFVGQGDFHDPSYTKYAVSLNMTDLGMFNTASAYYSMTLYPTQEFFDVYSTRNPKLSSLGAIGIIALTSLLFLLYDLLVRREFHAKKELLTAKREFVNFVSHEVRTPLNSVCMGLTVLQEEMTHSSSRDVESSPTSTTKNDHQSKKRSDWLLLTEEVKGSANSAVNVLNDLLNYDKVQSGKLVLEYGIVPFTSLVETTVSEFKLPTKNKEINLVMELPPQHEEAESYLVGDTVRLTQVIRNLISNAIKFTPSQGQIHVKLSRLERPTLAAAAASTNKSKRKKNKNISNLDRLQETFDLRTGETVSFQRSGRIRLTVTDTGAGMTQQQLREVFSCYSQFNATSLQGGNGSGLGTWIAKGIVRQHGGILSASSNGLGHGTTFTVELPSYDIPDHLQPPTKKKSSLQEQQESDTTIVHTNDGDSLKILVVDDAKMNVKLLMRLLAKRGHVVDGAEDGQAAVDKVKEGMKNNEDDFDVILMDAQMPRMNGPTACQQIRELGSSSFIVGITGNVMAEDVAYFKECGANTVLPKPIKVETLTDLFAEYGIVGGGNAQVAGGSEEPLPRATTQVQFQLGEKSGSIHSLVENPYDQFSLVDDIA